MALYLYSVGDFVGAISHVNSAIEIDQDFALAYKVRGDSYYDLGEIETAIGDLKLAIQHDPKLTSAYNNLGYVHFENGNYWQALVAFDQAIIEDPSKYYLFHNRGVAFLALQRFGEAVDDFDQSLKLQPDEILSIYNRGIALFNLKEFSDALSDFNLALTIDPNFAEIYASRGALEYIGFGNMDKAEADLNKAIELDTENGVSYFMRGSFYFHINAFDRAAVDFVRSLELMPELAGPPIDRCNLNLPFADLRTEIESCLSKLKASNSSI